MMHLGSQLWWRCSASIRAVTHSACLRRAAICSIPQPFSMLAAISIFLATGPALKAQHHMQVGAATQLRNMPGGVAGRLAVGQFEAVAWSDHIIRIRYTSSTSFTPMPYALQHQGPSKPWPVTLKQYGDTTIMRTAKLVLEIIAKPQLRFRFKDTNGQLLSEDAPGVDYGIQRDGEQLTLYKRLQPDEKLMGMGEALGPLNRRGTVVTLDNTDNYKYGDPRVPMYSSIPFFMGVHSQGMYGIFVNNSYRSVFNFGASTPNHLSVAVGGGDLDYFFLYDTALLSIVGHYASLTGTTPLPPLWSLGYHQSRCSYYPQQQVEWIAETFRKKQLPLDGIVLDADYQKDYRPFTVDSSRFPSLPTLAERMRRMQVRLTASVYPGIAVDSSYHAYRNGLTRNIFVKHPSGNNFTSEIAPVTCHFPDYTHPAGRQWWIDQMVWMKQNGIDGYWNDMNEPAVAASFLPDNLAFDFDGRGTGTREAKNVFGYQMARSSYEAAKTYRPGLRPFVLSRSGFSGIQRYAALWSGDNTASEEGLMTSVLLNTQLSLSGVSFCGFDIGGYIGDAPKDQFIRWMQLGMFSPYCRNHRGYNTIAGEPWAYGEVAEAISKRYLQLRYQMLPLWYSLFRQSEQKGWPVLRGLPLLWPQQVQAYHASYQYQFMLGDYLMVVPTGGNERSRRAWLPPGIWYDAYTDERYTGSQQLELPAPIHQLPVLVRSSAVVPMQQVIQHTGEPAGDTLTLHVYAGEAQGTLQYYEDAGDGFSYQEGDFFERTINWHPSEKRLQLLPAAGKRSSKFSLLKVVLHGGIPMPEKVQSDGAFWQPNVASVGIVPADETSTNVALQDGSKTWQVVVPFVPKLFSLTW